MSDIENTATSCLPVHGDESAVERRETQNPAEDDSPSALNLRNLYRGGKIGKDQYIGGLATLVATGLISKSEFTRLKASC